MYPFKCHHQPGNRKLVHSQVNTISEDIALTEKISNIQYISGHPSVDH